MGSGRSKCSAHEAGLLEEQPSIAPLPGLLVLASILCLEISQQLLNFFGLLSPHLGVIIIPTRGFAVGIRV